MFSISIVVDLDVFKKRPQGTLMFLESFVVDQFGFEDNEKQFRHRML